MNENTYETAQLIAGIFNIPLMRDQGITRGHIDVALNDAEQPAGVYVHPDEAAGAGPCPEQP